MFGKIREVINVFKNNPQITNEQKWIKEFEEFKGEFMAKHQNPKNREYFLDAEPLLLHIWLESRRRFIAQLKKDSKLAGVLDIEDGWEEGG